MYYPNRHWGDKNMRNIGANNRMNGTVKQIALEMQVVRRWIR